MLSFSSIILLSAASSHFIQQTLAQAIVFPYNCASTVPICQTDCITAVNNICSGKVGTLNQEQSTTVNGCTAKYVPLNGIPDIGSICLANFQKILDASSPSATTCDGKTLPQVGGVLAIDANNKPVPGTSYAIFPASNNPNCVVNPSQIKAPVPSRYSLNGKIYNPSLCPNTASGAAPGGVITARVSGWCAGAIAGAAVCGSSCVVAVVATLLSWGLASPIAGASCMLCTGPAVWGAVESCPNNNKRDILGRPVYMPRNALPALCAGNGLNPSLTIIPSCLTEAFQETCESLSTATA